MFYPKYPSSVILCKTLGKSIWRQLQTQEGNDSSLNERGGRVISTVLGKDGGRTDVERDRSGSPLGVSR